MCLFQFWFPQCVCPAVGLLGLGEDSWESLGHKEIKPVHPKGNQPWIFIGRTDAEAEAPILWPPDMKSWLIGKDPMLGKVERTRRRRTEDEVVGWHHWFNAPELKQTPGSSEGQGSLAGCSPWGRKESDITEWLNWTVLYFEHSLALLFFEIAMKTDLFQSCGHCWNFQIFWHTECSTLRIWNSSAGIPSPPLALFVAMLPKAHLTSHSNMPGSRSVTTPS